MAKEDPIQVVFKYLFLGEVLFDPVRQKGFCDLPSITLFQQFERLPTKLLSDRACSLCPPTRFEVEKDGSDNSNPVHALMFEETRILCRDECSNQLLWHLIDGHRQSVLHAEVFAHL